MIFEILGWVAFPGTMAGLLATMIHVANTGKFPLEDSVQRIKAIRRADKACGDKEAIDYAAVDALTMETINAEEKEDWTEKFDALDTVATRQLTGLTPKALEAFKILQKSVEQKEETVDTYWLADEYSGAENYYCTYDRYCNCTTCMYNRANDSLADLYRRRDALFEQMLGDTHEQWSQYLLKRENERTAERKLEEAQRIEELAELRERDEKMKALEAKREEQLAIERKLEAEKKEKIDVAEFKRLVAEAQQLLGIDQPVTNEAIVAYTEVAVAKKKAQQSSEMAKKAQESVDEYINAERIRNAHIQSDHINASNISAVSLAEWKRKKYAEYNAYAELNNLEEVDDDLDDIRYHK